MSSKRQFQVMARFRPFIRHITAFNVENFTGTGQHFLAVNVSRAVIMSTLFAILLIVCLLDLWLCLFKEREWNRRAYQFATALCLMQQFVIYVLMSSKNRQITGVLDEVQGIVDSRKLLEL